MFTGIFVEYVLFCTDILCVVYICVLVYVVYSVRQTPSTISNHLLSPILSPKNTNMDEYMYMSIRLFQTSFRIHLCMLQFKAWDHTHGHVTLFALVAGGLSFHPLFVRTYSTVVLFSFLGTIVL